MHELCIQVFLGLTLLFSASFLPTETCISINQLNLLLRLFPVSKLTVNRTILLTDFFFPIQISNGRYFPLGYTWNFSVTNTYCKKQPHRFKMSFLDSFFIIIGSGESKECIVEQLMCSNTRGEMCIMLRRLNLQALLLSGIMLSSERIYRAVNKLYYKRSTTSYPREGDRPRPAYQTDSGHRRVHTAAQTLAKFHVPYHCSFPRIFFSSQYQLFLRPHKPKLENLVTMRSRLSSSFFYFPLETIKRMNSFVCFRNI